MLFVLRMLMMGVHFVIAGILGLLLGLCRPFHPDNSRLCARLYSLPALCLLRLGLRSDTRSLAEHERSCVIVANHQSNYDLYVLGRVVPPRTVSIGKKSLKWIPLFGQLYWLAGNVLIDRGNARRARRSMLETTEALLHRNTSIWVFPEGTRNGGGEMLPFKRGAFQMAIAAGVPIIPVCVSSYIRHLRLNRWNSGKVMIRSLPAIPTAGLSMDDLPHLIDECRQRMQACIDSMDAELNNA
ncbi:lysophospholipid acyltransferase family protein [Phytopseudomonas dryadis]|uniref:1-acyl-sn-glycerol-3-phosphate acyltransferase n=1 Tax=Phytopseudomonas dryadis TaxID=2487520 RepID=A0A4Q9QWD3_9GAMM|nr:MULTISPECIES: 1-acylglycerol-3-phosphate O-acyltransferase [Pseudomonas]TBU88500.1 1-acyl-sn-glycerol-3-phosphate acyltransferase [Pseudomonas dryadis]TBV09490.1 1-acyl-sn-glycerol-3-phosphate acyltransferase [Pseudomonas dryadis]TBV18834.1 1-acyl-sn-glycerol-3-phosphate acyltransferase [Pseudomonas sp. FRB 230]